MSRRAPGGPGAGLRAVWHRIGTNPSQTRAQEAAIVDLEGGGTANPTLGGGFRVMAGTGVLAVDGCEAGR